MSGLRIMNARDRRTKKSGRAKRQFLIFLRKKKRARRLRIAQEQQDTLLAAVHAKNRLVTDALTST